MRFNIYLHSPRQLYQVGMDFLGKVVDQNNAPVSGAIVYIYSANPVALKRTSASDKNGMIQVNLEPGGYSCLMDDASNFLPIV